MILYGLLGVGFVMLVAAWVLGTVCTGDEGTDDE